MKTPNPEHIRTIKSFVEHSPFPALIDMRLSDIGVGFAALEIDLEKKHLQLLGVVHGGVIASLIDTASFWAVYYDIEDPDAWLVTVDLKLNFLAPAVSGTIRAEGQRIRAGRTICYSTASVTDASGNLVAHGASTLMVIRNRHPDKGVSFPGKFMEDL